MAGMARLLEAGTPLGKDVLVLQRMAGKEELGRLPEFQLDFWSRRPDIFASIRTWWPCASLSGVSPFSSLAIADPSLPQR